MNRKPIARHAHQPITASQVLRVPEITATCAAGRLHTDVDRVLGSSATARHGGAALTSRSELKEFGEITWRQIGRQGKGGAN